MPAVVSDTSVLHYLAVTGQFDCLPKLFGAVLIPPGVWNGVSHHPELLVYSFATKATAAGWLKVKAPQDTSAVKSFLSFLGAGESEALVLAKEHQPSLVLMDDLDGRQAAQRLNLMVMGTVGVLMQARKQHLLPKLKPVLDELVNTHRFRFDKVLYAKVLHEVGESE